MKLRMDSICDQLKGKTLIDVGYGFVTCPEEAKDQGERYMPLPAKIKKAWISTTQGDRDPCVRFEFEGHEDSDGDFYVYDCEEITID